MRGYSTHLGVLEGNAPETFWHAGPGRVFEPRFLNFSTPNTSGAGGCGGMPEAVQTRNPSTLLRASFWGCAGAQEYRRIRRSRFARDSNDSVTPLIYKDNFRRSRAKLNQSVRFLIQCLHSLNQSLHRLIHARSEAESKSSDVDSKPSQVESAWSQPDSKCSLLESETEPISRKLGSYWAFVPGVNGPGGALVIRAVTSNAAMAQTKVSQKASI